MMTFRIPPSDRMKGAAAAIAVQAAIGYALFAGLAASFSRVPDEALSVFRVAPPPAPLPRERVVPPVVRSTRPEGQASLPNLSASPSEVVAPPAVMPVPPPMLAAPTSGPGTAPAAGAAEVRGPGYGAGGIGDGLGGGGSGDGDGGGRDEIPPRWRKGELRDSDFPDTGDADISGKVAVRFLVGTDGRVSECVVTRSSGNQLLDATTCRLIRQRYRYHPSRDAAGRPVPAWIVETHEWLTARDPAIQSPPRGERGGD